MNIDWHCLCGDSLSSHNSRADGEVCYGHCQRTERDCLSFGYRPIPHDGRNPAVSALLTEVNRYYLPRNYSCDVSTDYQALTGPDAYIGRFIWVLRYNGTELYRMDEVTPTEAQGSLIGLDYWAENGTVEDTPVRIYYWDTTVLQEVDLPTARRLLRNTSGPFRLVPNAVLR